MQYQRLGNAVAVVLASIVGLSFSTSIKPIQAETSDSPAREVAAKVSDESDNAQPESEVRSDVAKVGESSAQQATAPVDEKISAIAKVFPHVQDDRQAATVYVRNIPVLTFLGDVVEAADAEQKDATNLRKLAATKAAPPDAEQPLWKANKLVAEFNQLNRSGQVDGEEISVRWEDDLYIIEHGEDILVTLDEDAILPDTTGAAAEDALQAANRLRRLLGEEEANALTEVADLPAPPEPEPQPQAIAYGGSFYEQGEASWYGPGFHGNLTANGERYNQWAMTAAHKYLPFGTLVRVTNLYSGAAAVVRINDRGPYAHGRVIDLSAAAADAIGMGGVASVKIDILN